MVTPYKTMTSQPGHWHCYNWLILIRFPYFYLYSFLCIFSSIQLYYICKFMPPLFIHHTEPECPMSPSWWCHSPVTRYLLCARVLIFNHQKNLINCKIIAILCIRTLRIREAKWLQVIMQLRDQGKEWRVQK